MFMWFTISYLSTAVVIHKNKAQKKLHIGSNSNNLREQLNDILQDELQINKFIEYLSREYVPIHLKSVCTTTLYVCTANISYITDGEHIGIHRIHTISNLFKRSNAYCRTK